MNAAEANALEFRMMHRNDLPDVLQIERVSFRTPWDESRFLQALEGKSGSRCVVMELAGKVVGYFVLELHATSTHIINLAIHPEHRRRGHGSRCILVIEQLALKAMEIARARDAALQPLGGRAAAVAASGAKGEYRSSGEPPGGERKDAAIHLEVEESNLPAQLLYRKMGYRATKILRNYYPALEEDGYRFEHAVPASSLRPA